MDLSAVAHVRYISEMPGKGTQLATYLLWLDKWLRQSVLLLRLPALELPAAAHPYCPVNGSC